MRKGYIKTYFEEKGFGFIVPDDGGGDIFFHKSVVRDRGYPLQTGAPVEFQSGVDPKTRKTRASVVVILDVPGDVEHPPISEPGDLPTECIFESFYGDDGKLQARLFYEAPQAAAKCFSEAGLKANQLRQLYQGLQAFVGPLSNGQISFEDAREKFGVFYVERVVRQAQRGMLPDVVRKLIDAHKELALKSREEMLGLSRYVTNILCYFGDKA